MSKEDIDQPLLKREIGASAYGAVHDDSCIEKQIFTEDMSHEQLHDEYTEHLVKEHTDGAAPFSRINVNRNTNNDPPAYHEMQTTSNQLVFEVTDLPDEPDAKPDAKKDALPFGYDRQALEEKHAQKRTCCNVPLFVLLCIMLTAMSSVLLGYIFSSLSFYKALCLTLVIALQIFHSCTVTCGIIEAIYYAAC